MTDWQSVVPPDLAHLVRPETRSKYFPRNPLRQYLISGFLEKVVFLVKKTGARKILDIGSGEGLVDFFLSRQDQGISLIGGDFDTEVLQLSQKINPEGAYLGLDARALPFEDSSFELVMMMEVIEHLEDYKKALKEASRVSKRFAILSVPEWPFYQASNFLILKNMRNFGEHPDHVVQFTARSLKNELMHLFRAGVEVHRSFPWIIALAMK